MDNVKNNNEKKALELINYVFGTGLSTADYEKNIKTVLKWDSFMIVSLLAEVMERYNRKTDLSKVFNVGSVKDLVVLISETIAE